ELCLAARTLGETVDDAATHLRQYDIKEAKGEAKHVPQVGLTFVNGVGRFTVETKKPKSLLVPTAESPIAPVVAPDPLGHAVDHFKCYQAKLAKGGPKLPKGFKLTVADGLEAERVVEIAALDSICLAVDKLGEGIKDAGAGLMCFKVKLS